MKKFFLFFAMMTLGCGVYADVYTRVTKFDKIGTEFQDTFLLVCEYAGNAYIFDGQSTAGHNYTVLTNFTGNRISGDYKTHECVLLHNGWHSYDKLCSILCYGEGDRPSGYYLGGVGGGNGIQFSKGQLDVEVTWQGEFGIDIVSKTGSGKFQFNTKDHGFKFYQNEQNMLRPVLYVKGDGAGYVGDDESVNLLDINYVQADLYARYSDFTNNLYAWDLRLNNSDDETSIPRVETSILTSSMTSLAGSYSQTKKSTQAGWVASDSYIQFPSSEAGGTQAKLTTLEFTIAPVSPYDEKWYNYHIVLNGIDSNKKRWKLDKVLPIFCTFTDRDPNNKEVDLPTDFEYVMNETLPTGVQVVPADELGVFAENGTVSGPEGLRIYDLTGRDMTRQNGQLQGIYVVVAGNQVTKIAVK